jgi:hypothetical protein
MGNVGSAIHIAQAGVLGADIEQQDRLAGSGVGHSEQGFSPGIGHDQPDAIPGDLLDERFWITALGELVRLQREGLLGETARSVVVVDGQLGPARAGIGGRDRQARDRQGAFALLGDVRDRDRDGRLRQRDGRDGASDGREGKRKKMSHLIPCL